MHEHWTELFSLSSFPFLVRQNIVVDEGKINQTLSAKYIHAALYSYLIIDNVDNDNGKLPLLIFATSISLEIISAMSAA